MSPTYAQLHSLPRSDLRPCKLLNFKHVIGPNTHKLEWDLHNIILSIGSEVGHLDLTGNSLLAGVDGIGAKSPHW